MIKEIFSFFASKNVGVLIPAFSLLGGAITFVYLHADESFENNDMVTIGMSVVVALVIFILSQGAKVLYPKWDDWKYERKATLKKHTELQNQRQAQLSDLRSDWELCWKDLHSLEDVFSANGAWRDQTNSLYGQTGEKGLSEFERHLLGLGFLRVELQRPDRGIKVTMDDELSDVYREARDFQQLKLLRRFLLPPEEQYFYRRIFELLYSDKESWPGKSGFESMRTAVRNLQINGVVIAEYDKKTEAIHIELQSEIAKFIEGHPELNVPGAEGGQAPTPVTITVEPIK